MRRLDEHQALTALRWLGDGDDLSACYRRGYDKLGWSASVWLLNPMYERGPSGTQRLRWSEYAERHGLTPGSTWPNDLWFGAGIADNLDPPLEGSLEDEDLRLLLQVLSQYTDTDAWANGIASYGLIPWFDQVCVFEGELSEIRSAVNASGLTSTPDNFWPADRSWFVYTDVDLWATKISGSPELIAAIKAEPAFETSDWN